jgi:hypothetical protein
MAVKKVKTKARTKSGKSVKIAKKPRLRKSPVKSGLKKETAAPREIFALPPSRLERVLHRIPPPRSDKNQDIDVEEYLVAHWQDRAKQSKVTLLLEALKNAKPASAVKKAISLDNMRDFFPYLLSPTVIRFTRPARNPFWPKRKPWISCMPTPGL